VTQKKWDIAPKRDTVATAKVQKLLEAGFIRDC